MCGIILEYRKQGNINRAEPTLWQYLAMMNHRGGQENTCTVYKTCEVGFTRLPITAKGERQPGISGEWNVYLNGEIYNWTELGFPGQSECEVLARAFDEIGIADVVPTLNGVFVIVAVREADVYVVRDRYGARPFYYHETETTILMASEIKPIINHPSYKFRGIISESGVSQFRAFTNILTPSTFFKGVMKFTKGCFMNLRTGENTKYHKMGFAPFDWRHDYDEAQDEVRRLVKSAIKRQIPKGIPYGICLSSGVDSNIIKAVVHTVNPDAPTFTAGFHDECDESAIVAGIAGRNHFTTTYREVVNLPETIYHLEDVRMGASWSNYGLYELASKFVRVIFDGAGGDELFGGYVWRYNMDEPYGDIVFRTGDHNDYAIRAFNACFESDTEVSRRLFDFDYFLEGLLIVSDRLAAAHTMEVRTPFLDNDLWDYVTSLPFGWVTGKKILRDAFREEIAPVANLPKRGFSSPDWFPGDGSKAEKWVMAAIKEWHKLYGNDSSNSFY